MLELLLDEAVIVELRRALHCRCFGAERLQHYGPSLPSAPRAPGDLSQDLKAALGRAEVRLKESGIRGDHADERQLGEIEALRDHLRPDQDVDVALAEGVQHQLIALAVTIVSESMRATTAPGKSCLTMSSTLSVPEPSGRSLGLWHVLHISARGASCMQ
jgi:hypothetical protein